MPKIQKNAFTLIELIIAVLLFSMVMVTAVTVELALRKMQIRPSIDATALDELVPVMERIKKDVEMAIGSAGQPPIALGHTPPLFTNLVMWVDTDHSGNQTAADELHCYLWSGGGGQPYDLQFSKDGSNYVTIAKVTRFDADLTNDNIGVTATLYTRKRPELPEDPVTNPTVNITGTFRSRMSASPASGY